METLPGNVRETRVRGATQTTPQEEPAPVVVLPPKRAYHKPVLKRYGVLKSQVGSQGVPDH